MSDEPKRIIPNKNREAQICPTGRKLFDAARKRVFLEWFAGTANLSLSARKAGVHYRTVLRHRMEKPAFREAFDRALDQATPRLRAWLVEAGEAEKAPIAFDGSGPGDPSSGQAGEDSPGGCTAPANLDAAQAMQLLRDDRQRAAAGAGRPGRTPTVASNEEVRQALAKRLKAFGIRVRAEREGAPPPCFARSPSPRNRGEE